MQEYTLSASAVDAGRRLDIFICDFAKKSGLGLSREQVQRIINKGLVRVNNLSPVKSHYKIKDGDLIAVRVEDKEPRLLSAEDIPFECIYEDADLAVINKPAGLVVHPAPGNYEHTLVNALLSRFKQLSDINPQRPGIVHRLDKGTSGLLVIAKNNTAHLNLAQQFSKHTVKRKYIALVKGRVEFDEDVIELPIGRHPFKRKNMAVDFKEGSRYAKTSYKTLKRSKDASLLELTPFTGRTHQLRVHLAYLGHPILGDTKYGKNNEFPRLALHARDLGFIHPGSGKFLEFSSPVPAEFGEFINKNT